MQPRCFEKAPSGRVRPGWLALLVLSAALTTGTWARAGDVSEADPAKVEYFEKTVRPILVERCQGCHGPSKQKGGLRLDSRAAILGGGDSGPAVVPGDSRSSLLVEAINYGDDVQMPPKSKLPASEIAALTRWVESGVPWGRDVSPKSRAQLADFGETLRVRSSFWSFRPLRDPAPPSPADPAGWARNPIDRFLLDRLASRGLEPAPEASRRTLIRRLSFDLTGLPPTSAEVEAFLADRSPDAYERLVDRLLASPRYGERWGRHWLDLVRYAETSGHEFDYAIPNAFRYRDYVIRAMNADLPFDRFLVEHLAGDLLEGPRRHPVEGFNESIIGTGFLYLGEGTHSPVDVREEEVRRVDNQIDVISKAFLGLTVACARCHDHKFDPIASKDYYALAGYLRSSRYQEAFIDPPGRIGEPVRKLGAIRDEIASKVDPGEDSPERVDRRAGDRPFEDFDGEGFADWQVSGEAFGDRPTRAGDLRVAIDGEKARLERCRPGVAHSGTLSNRLLGVIRSRTFTIEHRYIHYLVAGRGGMLNVVVDGFEKIRDPIYGGLTRTVDVGDDFRWMTLDVGMWVGQSAYLEIADGAVPDFRGGGTTVQDGRGYIAVDEIRMSDQRQPPPPPRWEGAKAREIPSGLAARYREVEATIPTPTLALAVVDGTGVDEHVMIRGNYRTPGERVGRRLLEVLGGTSMSTPASGSGRLELARRLVDPASNPVTPRVLVNRLWQHHFGEGIVPSVDDFGLMGREPTHPELLDWLASRFVESGWSLKAMHRLMLMSSAYRMSSMPMSKADRIDPQNAMLHRMNVRRLEAETIRDAILAVSGRLDSRMYGPGVPVHLSPFMTGRGRPGHSGPLDGNGRRSIYQEVRRNFLMPMFLAFDTPTPFSCMGRRNVSNVPAQALILLNDPMVIAEAHRWADRVLSGPGRDDKDRITGCFLDAFGRPPTHDEVESCRAFLNHAGWEDLCHVLLNMKEFVFIN